jgi:hypothetical protein
VKFLLFRVAGPVLATLLAFFGGLPMTDRGRHLRWLSCATWLRGGAKVATTRAQHLHWYAWPGWQRQLVRLAMVALAAALAVWPLWTGLALAGTALASGAAAYRVRRVPRPAVTVGEPVQARAVTR